MKKGITIAIIIIAAIIVIAFGVKLIVALIGNYDKIPQAIEDAVEDTIFNMKMDYYSTVGYLESYYKNNIIAPIKKLFTKEPPPKLIRIDTYKNDTDTLIIEFRDDDSVYIRYDGERGLMSCGAVLITDTVATTHGLKDSPWIMDIGDPTVVFDYEDGYATIYYDGIFWGTFYIVSSELVDE